MDKFGEDKDRTGDRREKIVTPSDKQVKFVNFLKNLAVIWRKNSMRTKIERVAGTRRLSSRHCLCSGFHEIAHDDISLFGNHKNYWFMW